MANPAMLSLRLRSAVGLGAVVVTTLLTQFGCTAPSDSTESRDEARVAKARSAIQGGVIDTKDTFSIALRGRGLCTATLIAPNLVLTARHCVEQSPSTRADGCEDHPLLDPGELFVTTSSTPLESQDMGDWTEVSKVMVGPKKNGCDPDIALVELAQPIPASKAKPATPAVDPSLLANSAHFSPKVTAIGFGLDDSGQPGTRRKREDISVLCVIADTNFKCGMYESWIQKFEIVAGKGACEGDSGGGLFDQKSIDDNNPVVVATVSRGPVDEQTGACLEGAYVRVDQFADFIKDAGIAAAKRGGYEAPAWTSASPAPAAVDPTPVADDGEAVPAAETPAAPAPATTTTTTTTGMCAAAPASRGSTSTAFTIAALAFSAAFLRRRRSRWGLRPQNPREKASVVPLRSTTSSRASF